VAAVIPPCSLTGVALTIRKFNAPNFGLAELIASGSLAQEAAALLVKAVLDRQNILISGGTGTGKTTLLSILANFIPKDERILVIEDTAELQVCSPYRQTPGTAGTIRRPDRLLAAQLYARRVPLHAVQNALVLAASRLPGGGPFRSRIAYFR
jgi:type IV secretory pathway ATPase VirB11/archaellum biosynthesis ATPase